MTGIYTVPGWLLMSVVTAAFIFFACAGHLVVRRTFKRTDFIEHNEVAGFIVAVVGVLYAVLLAFTTVIVWEHFSAAEDRASEEVDAVTDIWRLADHVAPADRLRITGDVDSYAQIVAGDEWPKMQTGRSSAQAQGLIVRILADCVNMRVVTRSDANLQSRLLDRIQVMADLRRRRINDNRSGIPAVMWLALAFGAAVVIGFLYLFGLKNFRVQILMTAATAALIGLSFSVVVALDFPFRGDVSVSPERWVLLHEMMAQGPPSEGAAPRIPLSTKESGEPAK